VTVVAKYIGEIGALPTRSRPVVLNKRKKPARVGGGARPGALRPTGATAAPRATTANVARIAPLVAARAAAPTTLQRRKLPAPSSPSSSSSSSSSSPPPSYYADASASSSSSGGGGGGGSGEFWPGDAIASAGSAAPAPEDTPIGDAYVSVSGGIPDGAFYTIMAATAAAVGFFLWRRSRRK
jgi:hypothetical protein